METAKFILEIFKHFLPIVFSWGFHCPVAIENGLRFYTLGFIHTGAVEVLYDEGYDLFTVKTINDDGSLKEERDGIYLDGLVETVDLMVERCPNYEDRVRSEYGFTSR